MEKRVTHRHTTRKPRAQKASTRDILARSNPREHVPKKWAEHHRKLIDLRQKLTGERSTLKDEAAEETTTFSLHMADAGTDSYDRDWALGMLSNEQDALYEIEQALARIQAGTYGICEMTGKRIPAARLAAIPWTRFSAEAEKKLEAEGGTRRAGIGRRESVPRTSTDQQVGEEQG